MAETRDEGFELLPPEVEPFDADDELSLEDELAEALEPLELDDEDEQPPPLGRTPAYDFHRRRFVPGTAGGPLMLTGRASLGQWLEKCLRTRRDENPACDSDFGVEIMVEDLLDGGVIDHAAVAQAQDDWARAFRVHPRVSDVDDWKIEYEADDDAVFVSCRVTPEGDDEDDFVVDRLPLTIGGTDG